MYSGTTDKFLLAINFLGRPGSPGRFFVVAKSIEKLEYFIIHGLWSEALNTFQPTGGIKIPVKDLKPDSANLVISLEFSKAQQYLMVSIGNSKWIYAFQLADTIKHYCDFELARHLHSFTMGSNDLLFVSIRGEQNIVVYKVDWNARQLKALKAIQIMGTRLIFLEKEQVLLIGNIKNKYDKITFSTWKLNLRNSEEEANATSVQFNEAPKISCWTKINDEVVAYDVHTNSLLQIRYELLH